MIEYVNEAGEVTMGTNFGESYDKELALHDQGKREGIEIGKEEKVKELAIKMVQKKINMEDIIEITGLTKEEIENLMNE